MTNLLVSRQEPFLHEWIIGKHNVDYQGPLNLSAPVSITKNKQILLNGDVAQGTAILYRDNKVILSFAINDTSQLEVGEYEYDIKVIRIGDQSIMFSDNGSFTVTDDIVGYSDTKVRPWDLLNPSIAKASPELRESRLAICNSCEKLHLGVCSMCGCVMKLKTMLQPATCPLGKW